MAVNISYDENFSISTMECASQGTALVLTNHRFFRNIYGECAVYVNPNDFREVYKAIFDLLNKPDRLYRMSELSLSVARNYVYSNLAAREYNGISRHN
jgi:glycosyltransferase involved in cell wall biosynthesis